MSCAGKQSDHAAIAKGRRHNSEIVQMAGALPWVVRDIDIALIHGFRREDVEKMHHGAGHGVDMPRRAGHCLGKHLSLKVKHTSRDVACFARGGAERGPHKGLRLLLNYR